MPFYPENVCREREVETSNLEMCLQIIAGVRDTWTLDDDECRKLNLYAGVHAEDAYDRLRRVDGLAKKAACAMASNLARGSWG